ncbi:hypothetical protein BGZ76_001588 [Entomortierella beljakovae]|nr:hypothetical protein BGZ76_001588 [Entomortierella beljakovae]
MPLPYINGLVVRTVVDLAASPADRIRMLLQTQDEIILNLREESQIAHTKSKKIQELDAQDTEGGEKQVDNDDDNDDDDDDEPRSIIVPYAQLPYTDARDCVQRLVEKEGVYSLWRGHYLKAAGTIFQSRIESVLNRSGFGSLFDFRRLFSSPIPLNTFLGSTAWILSSALQDVSVNAVALLFIHPFMTLYTKMAVDVVRRTRSIKTVPTIQMISTEPAVLEPSSQLDATEKSSHESVGSFGDSVEWIDNSEDGHDVQGLNQELVSEESKDETTIATKPSSSSSSSSSFSSSIQEYAYTLSYKYSCVREIVKETFEAEGYLGFYKGFSTSMASKFISHAGYLTIYHLSFPRLSTSSPLNLGTFALLVGTVSMVNLAIHPFSTIRYRRIIAGPGRYTSSWDAGKQIVEKQGWRSLYVGVEAVLVRGAIGAVLLHLLS